MASSDTVSMRRHVRTAVIAGLTAGLVAFFLRNADLQQVWREIGNARVGFLVITAVTTGLLYVVRSVRWQVLLRPIGPTRFRTAFRTTVIGFAASSLLPARPGEVLRPYLLARQEGLSATAAFASILLERLLDLITVLLLFGAFLFLFDPGVGAVEGGVFEAITIGGAIGAVAAIVALGLAFALAGHPDSLANGVNRIEQVLPARIARIIARLVRTFAAGLGAARRPKTLAVALILSVPLWLLAATGIWSAAEAFHLSIPFTGSFLLLALLVVGVSVPTPGGVGGFHAAFQIGATTFYGAPNDQAVAAAIVLHAITFVPVALVGGVFMAQDGMSFAKMGTLVPSADHDAPAPDSPQGSDSGGGGERPGTPLEVGSATSESEGGVG